MNAARGWHSMCVANENLYVFGGCYLANTTISNIGGNFKKKLTLFIGYIPNFFFQNIQEPELLYGIKKKFKITCVYLIDKNNY